MVLTQLRRRQQLQLGSKIQRPTKVKANIQRELLSRRHPITDVPVQFIYRDALKTTNRVSRFQGLIHIFMGS